MYFLRTHNRGDAHADVQAANLTSQVRAFAQISAAATAGDFSSFVTVEASGEMNALKDKINEMVVSLRESLQKNTAAKEAAETANRSKSEFLANMVRCRRQVAWHRSEFSHSLTRSGRQ